uniref:Putative restriction endonuclease domain-containing protein n=1 Tax=Cyanothece sp. (strain PCC 7425 / ATCC 29141) TaxID=395961 RepID=B8HML6_CYAP4
MIPTSDQDRQILDTEIQFPPGDLWSDEPPLETELHLRQLMLLIQCLEAWWSQRNDFYAFGNLTVYYSPQQRKSEFFRGPDFFVVLGTERKPRKSWVVWEEGGRYPNVIVEILSDSTAQTDRGLKKQIYQDIWRTPEYFWFDPYTLELAGFALVDGDYEPLHPNPQGWLWSKQLELFLGVQGDQLRFFSPQGQLLPTPQEQVAIEQQQKELAQQQLLAEQQQKEQAQQQVDRLAAKLRELGIDPAELT